MKRLALMALVLVSTGCGGAGGKTCNFSGYNGALTFTWQGQSITETCFDGTNTQGNLDIGSPNPPEGETRVAMGITLLGKASCGWADGVTKPLTSDCLTIHADEAFNNKSTGQLEFRWFGNAGGGPGTYTPDPTGSITVTHWATGPNQHAEVTFSSDAALSYTNDPAGNTGPTGLVTVSGTAGITTGT